MYNLPKHIQVECYSVPDLHNLFSLLGSRNMDRFISRRIGEISALDGIRFDSFRMVRPETDIEYMSYESCVEHITSCGSVASIDIVRGIVYTELIDYAYKNYPEVLQFIPDRFIKHFRLDMHKKYYQRLGKLGEQHLEKINASKLK